MSANSEAVLQKIVEGIGKGLNNAQIRTSLYSGGEGTVPGLHSDLFLSVIRGMLEGPILPPSAKHRLYSAYYRHENGYDMYIFWSTLSCAELPHNMDAICELLGIDSFEEQEGEEYIDFDTIMRGDKIPVLEEVLQDRAEDQEESERRDVKRGLYGGDKD